MADRLPFGGSGNATPNKPKRMLYQQPSWTLPACKANISDLEYDYRVGKITEEEYMKAKEKESRREVAALTPATRKAVVTSPRGK
jgi:hypothetical protein